VREQRQEQEQPANTRQRAVARLDPEVREQRREQEQPANTRQQAVARLDPEVQARESRLRALASGKIFNQMACTFVNGEYLFHQPCGLWNEPCVHGCSYIHLSTSTPGTRKKCCVNGRLSSASDNFDEELMMGICTGQIAPICEKSHFIE